jgi:hypothetical protein
MTNDVEHVYATLWSKSHLGTTVSLQGFRLFWSAKVRILDIDDSLCGDKTAIKYRATITWELYDTYDFSNKNYILRAIPGRAYDIYGKFKESYTDTAIVDSRFRPPK